MSIFELSTHVTGALAATPRGSHPTTSKRRLRLARDEMSSRRNCTPDSPGPPGLSNIDPMRFEAVAGLRIKARAIVRPPV